MASLWNFYDGEPFLENPHLAVISNPRGRYSTKRKPARKNRKGQKSMARRQPAGLRRYWAKHRSKARKNPRRRSRRNPIPLSGVLANPRRRRRSRVRHAFAKARRYVSRRMSKNPRRHHRYRRNPSMIGGLPALWTIGYATGGFMVMPVIESLLRKYIIPTSLQTMGALGNLLIRVAGLLGLTFLTRRMLGGAQSTMVAIGGATYVAAQSIADTGFNLKTTLGLSGPYMGAYTGRPALNGMGAYTPGVAGTFQRRALGAPPYGAVRPYGAASAPKGGMNIVPLRFRRFQ